MNPSLKRSIEQKKAFNKALNKRITQIFGKPCGNFFDQCISCNAWTFYEDIKYKVQERE